uniref:EGF-like domain-containing protein n=1 Tax=Acanthochromis polyacanthus TaxID=80966 RepID=A0A3Q1HBP6_9TELE
FAFITVTVHVHPISFSHFLHNRFIVFVTLFNFISSGYRSDLDDPEGLAYDWIHNRVYFTDYYAGNVQSMGVDGKNRSIIVTANSPRGIIYTSSALSHPRYLYWTDWGSPAKIERATLSGNFQTTIISGNLVSPNGLTLDYEERMLYWADSSLCIERSTLTGENRQVIVHGVTYPFAMTVFQQDIFWTDWTERCVYRAGKDDGSDITAIVQDMQYRPNDIHVYAGSKQESCSSFCQQFNGGCSHICVSVGPECQCPEGKWYLANNGKDCIKDTGKRCQPEQFTCLNGNCISAQWKCDGSKDCQDNTDELERVCETILTSCKSHAKSCLFRLPLLSSFCAGVNECLSPPIHQCAQICTDTLTGYYCSCHPGYKLMPDGKACEDIDECLSTPAVCSQICENAFGSYHCKCAPGYIREPDGRTCRQNSGIAPYLLYSNRYYIRNLTTDGSHLSIVQQGLSNVVALDFDHYEKRLYCDTDYLTLFVLIALILLLLLLLIGLFVISYEKFCVPYKCDEDTEFSCKSNYRCIPLWERCDGTNDCIDNSDEQGCGQCLCVCRCVAVRRKGCNKKNCTRRVHIKFSPGHVKFKKNQCKTTLVFEKSLVSQEKSYFLPFPNLYSYTIERFNYNL